MPQEPEDFDALHGATELEAENASLRHTLCMALNNYRAAVIFARYQPGTFTLENAISYAKAQTFYESRGLW